MAHTADLSVDLSCGRCGYDLRAHRDAAVCPECGSSVAESRRLAAIPRRPAWRDCDPRWRRRMLAGVWTLVLVPVMDVLQGTGWAATIPAPTVFAIHNELRSLGETFLCGFGVCRSLLFCMGVVLLFSKERGRRPARSDWTRRWGVLCSYVTLLLNAVPILYITALVMVGISALFLSMPAKFQPRLTQPLLDVSTAYIRYGPEPGKYANVAAVAFSSITILLACVPLYDALHASGLRRFGAIPLVPLALFALMHLVQAGRDCINPESVSYWNVGRYGVYFWPDPLVDGLGAPPGSTSMLVDRFVEDTKWLIVLAIAGWLSVAQVAAWRRRTTAA